MDSSLFRNSRRPKVVSIPVHFVQSEQTRAASALKIQKVVRGFLVRKSVKQILAIIRDVEEMERWVVSEKVKSGIDDKERLRASEKLMSLLLKLDSVRGINSQVRDCRKRVIKKAIALQEKVDSIPKATNSMASASVPANESSNAVADNPAPTSPMEEEEPKTIHCMIDDGVVDPHEQEHMTAAGADNSCDGPCDNGHPEVEDPDEVQRSGDGKDVSVLVGKGDEEEEERDRKRTRELLEKMAEDNERLVGMLAELSQRNEMQTRLLSSLTQRVELLEKALVSEKLARKKKKRHGSS
uniref:BAG domain-containing protein n=1 Tax=Kalanchoe fedtschenkoi TaxID=63787 RepID=A0A7N0UCB6_KALFE